MVGIVAILLLGSLFWSAVGALVSAVGQIPNALSGSRPSPTRVLEAQATPTVRSAATPLVAVEPAPRSATPTLETRPATPTPQLTPAPTSQATPETSGRAPWVLMPQPAPDTRVPPGSVVLEARGRGDAPVTAIRLELDGASVPVTLEQRGDTVWRGWAAIQVSPGKHVARAVVTDAEDRSGSYRWSFEAGD
jgi:hypothetical protein